MTHETTPNYFCRLSKSSHLTRTTRKLSHRGSLGAPQGASAGAGPTTKVVRVSTAARIIACPGRPPSPAVDSRVALRRIGGVRTPFAAAPGDRARRPRLRRPLAPTPRSPPRAPRYFHAVLTPPSPVPPVPPLPPSQTLPGSQGDPSSAGAPSPGSPSSRSRRPTNRRRRGGTLLVVAAQSQLDGARWQVYPAYMSAVACTLVDVVAGAGATSTRFCARSSRAWGGSGRWCPPPRVCSRRCS